MFEMIVLAFILLAAALIVIAIGGAAIFMMKCDQLIIDVKYQSKSWADKKEEEL